MLKKLNRVGEDAKGGNQDVPVEKKENKYDRKPTNPRSNMTENLENTKNLLTKENKVCGKRDAQSTN